MKKIIQFLILSLCVTVVAFAGTLPTNSPTVTFKTGTNGKVVDVVTNRGASNFTHAASGVLYDAAGNVITTSGGASGPAAAGTLTGNTLASNVTASSLLSAAGGSFGSAAYTASTSYPLAASANSASGPLVLNSSGQIPVLDAHLVTGITGSQVNGMLAVSGTPSAGAITFFNSASGVSSDPTNLYWDDPNNSFQVGSQVSQTNFPGTVASFTMGAASQGYTQMLLADPTAAGQACYVANANDSTNTTHYINICQNNSAGPAPANAYFTNAHAGVLYEVDSELDIGVGLVTPSNAVINMYVGSNVAPAVSITASGMVPAWSTTAVSGVAGNGALLMVNTSAVPVTVTLPASSANATVTMVDYAGTFATHNLTVNAPSGVKLNGTSGSPASMTVSTSWAKWICVYLDATIGYRCYN